MSAAEQQSAAAIGISVASVETQQLQAAKAMAAGGIRVATALLNAAAASAVESAHLAIFRKAVDQALGAEALERANAAHKVLMEGFRLEITPPQFLVSASRVATGAVEVVVSACMSTMKVTGSGKNMSVAVPPTAKQLLTGSFSLPLSAPLVMLPSTTVNVRAGTPNRSKQIITRDAEGEIVEVTTVPGDEEEEEAAA